MCGHGQHARGAASAGVGVTALALALAVVGAGLLAAATRRNRPTGPLPDVESYLDGWSAVHGGYDPRASAITVGWLRLVHRCAGPVTRLGLAPDLLTLAAGWIAALALPAAAAAGRWALAGAAAVALSGAADSLDGAVAVLAGRQSGFGYVLDSLVDRFADGCYLAAFYLLGADGRLCAAAGAALIALEYTRARAGSAGLIGIGVLTPGERPTRILLAAGALTAAGLVPAHAALCAELGAAGTLVVCLLSAALLLRELRRRL